MRIIFVTNSTSKPKSIHLVTFVAIIFLLFIAFIQGINWIDSKYNGADEEKKSLINLKLDLNLGSFQKNLDIYAAQIGELQARLIRIDNQSQRLQDFAKEKLKTNEKIPKPAPIKSSGQGGPFVPEKNLSETELQSFIDKLTLDIEKHEEYYNNLEAIYLKQSVFKDTLPNASPVNVPFNSSSYGWRVDPFLGVRAFHEGLDFSADVGQPIKATAAGIVIAAEVTPEYGNVVRISHGSGLETRYAHASKLLVKEGDRIKKNQVIALVGNTGRSTGPHLHYEIRMNGESLDPRKYLQF
ncbi:MAG TPA: peptidase M23 [Methylophilaceae bacterium]|jgi:murein DD-endopeptidase MepM/ murein hydrolase activator NlpD|nr:peptidase M23 [Methylophilaceae bacterium]HBO18176.1 peptidase M23 [Methylophilaceae bacterium]HCC72723.1 peptidase M23 [Methylophilaceae bacterium]